MTNRFSATKAIRDNNRRIRDWVNQPATPPVGCEVGGPCNCGPMSPLCGHNTTFKGR